MVWKWNSLLASVKPSNHPSSWPAPVGRVQSLANSKQPSNHTVDGSLKAGKLTSWGTGSWHPIIYRGPYIHPRWLLGEISTVVVGKWIPYPIRSDMKCEGFLPCFFSLKGSSVFSLPTRSHDFVSYSPNSRFNQLGDTKWCNSEPVLKTPQKWWYVMMHHWMADIFSSSESTSTFFFQITC